MDLKEMLAYMKMEPATFAKNYRIPEEILQTWLAEESAPEYILYLLNRVVKEDQASLQKENATKLLYAHLGHDMSQIKWDKKFGYLFEQMDAHGEAYMIYKDEIICCAIRICDGTIVSDADDIDDIFNEEPETGFEWMMSSV